jgi:AraC-like DNA-binding protein
MSMPPLSKALFYSFRDRFLFLFRSDEYYSRTTGPAMLILSFENELEVEDEEGTKYLSYSYLVSAGAPVSIKKNYGKLALFFLKFSGSDFKKLIFHMKRSINYNSQYTIYSDIALEAKLIEALHDAWVKDYEANTALSLLEQYVDMFDSMHDKTKDYSVDPRVLRVIDMILDNSSENIPVSAFAKEVGLKPARLSELFRQTTGASIRSFRLWERFFSGVRYVNSGMSFTDAAAAAGFSDYSQGLRVYKSLGGSYPKKNKKFTDIKVVK